MKAPKILSLLAPSDPASNVCSDAARFELLVRAEIAEARETHGPYDNEFEALGVILEELDEFKEWVWKRRKDRDLVQMLGELVQVAATCRMASAECGYTGHKEYAGLVAHQLLDGSGTSVHSSHDGYARILVEIDRYKDGISKAAERRIRGNALLAAGRWCAATAVDVKIMEQVLLEARGLQAVEGDK